ncbi:MAG: ABC transporter ATP-binding protein [Actinobacteria bacterium]|nr:ABC transporter ATP-binding protein [Actinomycetota bacterium]
MENDIVVEVKDLKKTYGDTIAVDGISFNIKKGEIFGLLGPNGAGKTTTLECIEGLRKPDGGSFSLMGLSPDHGHINMQNMIGVQLQVSGLPGTMRADEAMNFFCAYHGVAPRNDILERLGLVEKINTQYQFLSTGQQRRLALALALAHEPPVLILDEPTAGLDVGSRVELHNIMEELKGAGTTILLATHDMAEAEKMSNRVAILLNGRIVATGTPKEITATGAGLTRITVQVKGSSLSNMTGKFPKVIKSTNRDGYVVYFSSDAGTTVSAIIKYISEKNDELIDLRVERPSLEERFLEITSNGAN